MNNCGQKGFSVAGTRIYGPDGSEFIMKGTNVNGYACWWGRETTQDASLITDVWKFNTIRVNCVLRPEIVYKGGTGSSSNNDIGRIVEVFTSRKTVVMLEAHDWTGKYPDTDEQLQFLKDWWLKQALLYKDNPYVWFNIMNEPGPKDLNPCWKTSHEEVIKAIRYAGVQNIIVCDGSTWGQEVGNSGSGMVTEADSAILSYGSDLVQYGNIVFSVHMYSCWNYPEAKFRDYVDKVHAKGLALIIGEFGVSESDNMKYSRVVRNALTVSAEKRIGWLSWAWTGGKPDVLTEGSVEGGGWEINRTDGSKPSNLSNFGEKVWDDSHGISPDFEKLDLAVTKTGADRMVFNPGDELQFYGVIKNTGDIYIDKARISVRFLVDDQETGNAEFSGSIGMGEEVKVTSGNWKAWKTDFALKCMIVRENSCYGLDEDEENDFTVVLFRDARDEQR